MASLNIPFLVFSRSTFTFETAPYCYSSLDNRTDIDFSNTLLISNPKGEIIIFSYELDVLLRRRYDIGHAVHSTTFYNLLLHPKLLMLPSISAVEQVGPLVDIALVENPSKYILVSPLLELTPQSATPHLYLTLHHDRVLRLWDMDDGRCIMRSTKELLLTKVCRVITVR